MGRGELAHSSHTRLAHTRSIAAVQRTKLDKATLVAAWAQCAPCPIEACRAAPRPAHRHSCTRHWPSSTHPPPSLLRCAAPHPLNSQVASASSAALLTPIPIFFIPSTHHPGHSLVLRPNTCCCHRSQYSHSPPPRLCGFTSRTSFALPNFCFCFAGVLSFNQPHSLVAVFNFLAEHLSLKFFEL